MNRSTDSITYSNAFLFNDNEIAETTGVYFLSKVEMLNWSFFFQHREPFAVLPGEHHHHHSPERFNTRSLKSNSPKANPCMWESSNEIKISTYWNPLTKYRHESSFSVGSSRPVPHASISGTKWPKHFDCRDASIVPTINSTFRLSLSLSTLAFHFHRQRRTIKCLSIPLSRRVWPT